MITYNSPTSTYHGNSKRYPTDQWLRVYKDEKVKIGDGVYWSSIMSYFPVVTYKSNFNTEMKVIPRAVLSIMNYPHNYSNTIILWDSKSSIQAMASSFTMDINKNSNSNIDYLSILY